MRGPARHLLGVVGELLGAPFYALIIVIGGTAGAGHVLFVFIKPGLKRDNKALGVIHS
ncbi:hypothetical protein [Manganibacter manganicus]|uniref:hypothetical protein n=1 Tax=Manganibacter manganicus TaxID=1873176 RepID=UPI001301A7D6|nr:hypothetical protein [Pseudaminobacter manganicus]